MIFRWPVIVVIIVGSLILIGIAWCIIGCLCCGYTCCKSCCSCCCPSGRSKQKRSKYADDPSAFHNPNYGYQPNQPPPVYEPQNKFAAFDTPSRPAQPVNEDALPPMPSWNDARTRQVENHTQDLELNRLDPTTGQTMGTVGRSGRGGYYEVPEPPGAGQEGYRGTEPTAVPYRQPSPAIGVGFGPDPVAYRQPSPAVPYRHGSPAIGVGFGQEPAAVPYRQPSPAISYRQGSPAIGVAQTHNYSADNGMDSPFMDNSPAVAGGMYANQPSRAYTRSPVHSPLPPTQTGYSPQPPIERTYSPYQPNTTYAPYSPPVPSSPPPPFTSVAGDNEQSARPPTMLMPGRKPADGSWRDV